MIPSVFGAEGEPVEGDDDGNGIVDVCDVGYTGCIDGGNAELTCVDLRDECVEYCKEDEDGDEFLNCVDDCPPDPGLEFNGCPDDDNDGVPLGLDECEGDSADPDEDGDGCTDDDLCADCINGCNNYYYNICGGGNPGCVTNYNYCLYYPGQGCTSIPNCDVNDYLANNPFIPNTVRIKCSNLENQDIYSEIPTLKNSNGLVFPCSSFSSDAECEHYAYDCVITTDQATTTQLIKLDTDKFIFNRLEIHSGVTLKFENPDATVASGTDGGDGGAKCKWSGEGGKGGAGGSPGIVGAEGGAGCYGHHNGGGCSEYRSSVNSGGTAGATLTIIVKSKLTLNGVLKFSGGEGKKGTSGLYGNRVGDCSSDGSDGDCGYGGNGGGGGGGSGSLTLTTGQFVGSGSILTNGGSGGNGGLGGNDVKNAKNDWLDHGEDGGSGGGGDGGSGGDITITIFEPFSLPDRFKDPDIPGQGEGYYVSGGIKGIGGTDNTDDACSSRGAGEDGADGTDGVVNIIEIEDEAYNYPMSCSDSLDNDDETGTDFQDPDCIYTCDQYAYDSSYMPESPPLELPDGDKKGFANDWQNFADLYDNDLDFFFYDSKTFTDGCCGDDLLSYGFELIAFTDATKNPYDFKLGDNTPFSSIVITNEKSNPDGGGDYSLKLLPENIDGTNGGLGTSFSKDIGSFGATECDTGLKRDRYSVVTLVYRADDIINGKISVVSQENSDIKFCELNIIDTAGKWKTFSCEFKPSENNPALSGCISINFELIQAEHSGRLFIDDFQIFTENILYDSGEISNSQDFFCYDQGSSWSFERAGDGGVPYVIKTLGNTIDVISNGEEWFACDSNTDVNSLYPISQSIGYGKNLTKPSDEYLTTNPPTAWLTSPFCGNTICEPSATPPETKQNCPNDCPIGCETSGGVSDGLYDTGDDAAVGESCNVEGGDTDADITCVNLKDDDLDGLEDCDDPDCFGRASCPTPQMGGYVEDCSDEGHLDEDGDGDANCEDQDCIDYYSGCTSNYGSRAADFSDKFICNKVGEKHLIGECCYGKLCKNGEVDDLSRVFAQGTNIFNVRNFDIWTDAFGLSPKIIFKDFVSGQLEIDVDGVTDWTEYVELHFDAKPNGPLNELELYDGDNFIYSFPNIYKNSTTYYPLPENKYDRWQHYILNLSKIPANTELKNIDKIRITSGVPGYANVRSYFDNFYLSKAGRADQNFCSGSFFEWISELDPPSDVTEYGPYAFACDAIQSFGWTGRACCGDDNAAGGVLINNTKEFYNDPPQNTLDYDACFAGYTIGNGERVNDTMNINFNGDQSGAVINFEGKFYGCNISNDNPLFNLTNDLMDEDLHYSERLLFYDKTTDERRNLSFCSPNPPQSDYVCSTTGNFLYKSDDIFGADLNSDLIFNLSDVNWTLQDDSGHRQNECCPAQGCWNGTSCVSEFKMEMVKNYTAAGVNDQNFTYVCRDSTWAGPYTEDDYKWDWNRENPNFCFDSNQCYCGETDCIGYIDGSKCVNETFFHEDHYCKAGNWSTRTALVAAELLDYILAKDVNYTLHCDNKTDALNMNIDHSDQTQVSYLNNVCILKYVDGSEEIVVIGSSIKDKDNSLTISDATQIKDKFQVTDDCEDALVDGDKYVKCHSTEGSFWYNNQTMSFIYSNKDITLSSNGLLTTLISKFKDIISTYRLDSKFLSYNVPEGNRLFFFKKGNKNITSVKQSIPLSTYPAYLTVEYKNLASATAGITLFDTKYSRIVYLHESFKIDSGNVFLNYTDIFDEYHEYPQHIENVETWPFLTYRLRPQ